MHSNMRRSKLMLYEDILCSLYNNSRSIDEIAYCVNMDCVALIARLEFLLKNKLIEEKIFKKNTLYSLTKRGLAIYKTIKIKGDIHKSHYSRNLLLKVIHARDSSGDEMLFLTSRRITRKLQLKFTRSYQ